MSREPRRGRLVARGTPAPVARKLSAYHRSAGTGGWPVLSQAAVVSGTACLVMLLAWERQRVSTIAIGISAGGAVVAGLITLHRIRRYLAAARAVTHSSLVPKPAVLVPDSEGT